MGSTSSPSTLEAKLVVLGFQGVGKTSLVHRFVKNDFIPPNQAQPTVGASFLTTRVSDPETGTTIRLQIWDTAGQERFRSISRLYYRGANAAIIAYDVTSMKSFDEMGVWLKELKDNCGGELVIHVVGTKTDVVSAEPQRREVPFERCTRYVAEQLYPEISPTGGRGTFRANSVSSVGSVLAPVMSSKSNRSSGLWAQETVFDFCHEVSAKDGEGIDEVFRVITRKLVDQHSKKMDRQTALETLQLRAKTPRLDSAGNAQGYFDLPRRSSSFRIGYGDKRRSWLGIPVTPALLTTSGDDTVDIEVSKGTDRGRCC